MKEWKQIGSKIWCENRWISVSEDRVLLPNGDTLDSYFVVKYSGAVAILLIEGNQVLMIEQYRYPLRSTTLEIPSGALLNPDEIREDRVLESAQHELLEETGYVAKSMTKLAHFHPSPGNSNEVIHIVRAEGILEKSDLGKTDPLTCPKWVSLQNLISYILNQQVTHGPTIVALFHLMRDKETL